MKIAFLGTPEFAVPSLQALIDAGHTLCVFSQPDRPVGRHGTISPTPVKALALRHGIPVYQFDRIRRPEGVAALRAFAPDLMVTAAFGQLLSQENLDVPRLGCINVHGSLLPKYRGAAPIQWAIIDGERVTGVTTMMTDIGMDTGDILLKAETPIGPDETAGELYGRLAAIGARVLLDTLDALQAGTLRRTPQDEALATKCCMLKKEHGKLDFQQTAQQVHDRVRGVNPWPGAYALLDDGSTLKVWRTQKAGPQSAAYPAGTCFGDARTGLFVQCADGAVELLEVQAAGGKRLDGRAFLRGRPIAGRTLS